MEAASTATHVYSRTYIPRVGIATLGAILKQRGYECALWYQAMSPVGVEQLLDYDLVGIGSLSSTINEAYRLADELRERGKLVVMGGTHVSFMPEEALAHCDYVVIGEGDASFPALVEALSNGESLESIPGLAFRKPGGVHFNDPAAPVDFAGLPSPDFSLSPQIDPAHIPPIIATSRGCPHDCTFCSVTTTFGRRYRFKDIEQVIAELRPIVQHSICFGDDNFCASPQHTKALLRRMLECEAVPLRWAGEMCVGAARDSELLELMQATRCRMMYVGIESVDDGTLKAYGKAHDLEGVADCVERLHAHDIGIHGMFVVGLEDSPDTARRIVDYARKVDLDTIQIMSLTPFPGTRSYEQYAERLLHRDWAFYDGMHVVARPFDCSAHEMQLSIIRQMQRFYGLRGLLRAWTRGRTWRLKYRAGGYVLSRRWERENKAYLERLKKA